MSSGGGGGGGGGLPAPSSSSYPDSVDSSPRSRGGDSWADDSSFSTTTPPAKLRFMCSYGGQIVPRPHDKSLCYLGGDTRMVVVDRYNTTLSDLSARLSRSLLSDRPFTLKYQLPSEDLDSLISVTTDEDLDNMVDEYDRLLSPSDSKAAGPNGNSRQNRIRLFLFPVKLSPDSSVGSLLDDSKSETWFVDALNSAIDIGKAVGNSSIDSLLGLEEERERNPPNHDPNLGSSKAQLDDTLSSFGSASSENNRFAQMNIKQEDVTTKEGGDSERKHYNYNSPPPPLDFINVDRNLAESSPASASGTTRFLALDDEKAGNRGVNLSSQMLLPSVHLQQPVANRTPPGAVVPNHDSSMKQEPQFTLSDSSYVGVQLPEQGHTNNTMAMHQEQFHQQQRLQQHQQHLQQQQQQFQQQQIQQQQQQQLQQQQQFQQQKHHPQQYVHTNNPQFTHQQGSSPMLPPESFYQAKQAVQSHQQLGQSSGAYNQQQIPVYFMPVGPNQSYMIPMQQSDVAQQFGAPAKPTSMPMPNPLVPTQGVPLPRPELGMQAPAPGEYRTTGRIPSAVPQQQQMPSPLIQLGDQTNQYVGYHSVSPLSVPAGGGYMYDPVQQGQPAIYYSQTTTSIPSTPQYQTTNSTSTVAIDMHQPGMQQNRPSQ